METKHIQRDDSPDGVWINVRDFDPNIHKLWVEPVPEIIKTVEVADLQEAIAPKKIPRKKVS